MTTRDTLANAIDAEPQGTDRPGKPDDRERQGRKSVKTVRRGIEVFAGSDGRFYTPSQIRHRCRSDAWRFCLRECESDRLLFETIERELVLLVPAEPTDLPPWIELRREAGVARAVDTRRAGPEGRVRTEPCSG